MEFKSQIPNPKTQTLRPNRNVGIGVGVATPVFGIGIWSLGFGICCALLTATLFEAPVSAQVQSRRTQPAKTQPARENVNRRNADGSTPLQWAVSKGDVSEVKRLL